MTGKIHIIGGYVEQKYTWTHNICGAEVSAVV
jgi:hypothetical protein